MSIEGNIKKFNGWLLLSIGLAAFLLNVDYTAVNLALVNISHSLNTSLTQVRWLLSGYMLVWAVIVVPMGKVLDRLGPRKMFVTGLGIFLIGSLVTGVAPNIEVCIAGRIIQGMAGAFYGPACYALIHRYIPENKVGAAMGFLSLGVGFGMAVGPSFGGVILTYLGWRWIFLINVPLSLFALLIAYFATQRETADCSVTKPDMLSSSLLGVFVLILVYSMGNWSAHGAATWHLVMLALGFLALVWFILRQAKIKSPLMPLRIFSNKAYSAVISVMFIQQFAFSSSMVVIALYLQKVLGFSALIASAMFLALNLLFGIIAPIGGRIVDRHGIRMLSAISLLGLALGFIAFACLGSAPSLWLILVVLAFIGLVMGLAFSALNSGVVIVATQDVVGISMGLFMLLALLGNVVAVTVATMIYIHHSAIHLVNALSQSLTSIQLSTLKGFIAHMSTQVSQLQYFSSADKASIARHLPMALNSGVQMVMFVAAGLLIPASVACWLCLKGK